MNVEHPDESDAVPQLFHPVSQPVDTLTLMRVRPRWQVVRDLTYRDHNDQPKPTVHFDSEDPGVASRNAGSGRFDTDDRP